MIIEKFVLTAFQQNTRVVACVDTGSAICIDPGESSPEIVEFVRSGGFTLEAVALTHGHLDHVGGTRYLTEAFPDAEVILHTGDEDLYKALPLQPLFLGMEPQQLESLGLKYEVPPAVSRRWVNGEVYEVGNLQFVVRHCPGHTMGHVILAEMNCRKVFVGDCLFEGSIGRTDLPGGNYEQLMNSINENILSLGDDFVVHSGHGRETTIGHERRTNPFLNGSYNSRSGRFI